MKARNENRQIKLFSKVPSEWKSYLNFDKAEDELLQAEGFFDVEIPNIDHETEYLGGI